MKTTNTKIKGLMIIEPDIFKDERGSFFESWNLKNFKEIGIEDNFIKLAQKGIGKIMEIRR